MVSLIKEFVIDFPKRWLKRILSIKTRPKFGVRKDLRIIPVDDQMQFLVYWKVLPHGKGPATVLEIGDREFAKFDCFGEKEGHYHISPHYDFRIFFHEKSREDQVNRTITELESTTQLYLFKHPDPKFKAIKIDQKKFEVALKEVRRNMMEIVKDIF
uniref:hypothetical protein n=1 Tax=Ekhidna sp. TaxID=2608089 RepID=UPI0032EF893F